DGCSAGDIIPITLRLDDDVEIGSLQLSIRYPGSIGAFDQYPTPSIKCSMPSDVNALYATYQAPRIEEPCDGCERTLNVGFAIPSGYTGPGTLLTCNFVVEI